MKPLILVIIIVMLGVLSGCQTSGTRRPDAPLCTPLSSDREWWGCTDSRGDYNEPVDNLIGTTLEGYASLEKYVDDLERENRDLRRRCE